MTKSNYNKVYIGSYILLVLLVLLGDYVIGEIGNAFCMAFVGCVAFFTLLKRHL